MRTTAKLLLCGGLLAVTAFAFAQPGRPATSDLVTKMMAFDANKDGKLTKEEVTDERLHRLFDQIDADKKGVVTKEHIEAFAAKQDTGGGGKGGPGGKGGKGDKGGKGGPGGGGGFPGGPGGGGGGFGPPPIGQLLPAFMADELKLTADQKKKLEELQKDTDTKLDKLLTDDQRKQLKEMKDRGPGRGGFPGGPGGPGGGVRGRGETALRTFADERRKALLDNPEVKKLPK